MRLVDLLGDDGQRLARAGERAQADPFEVVGIDDIRLQAPLPRPTSFRDFYAFEQHVRTARQRRGREMEPEWYQLPAAGFWNELIVGLRAFKARECPELPLGFFTWHDMVADQHAAHTEDELREAFDRPGFDKEKFLEGANEMLDGVWVFWGGLASDRHEVRRAA